MSELNGTVLVSETGVKLYQLIGRSGESVFPMGGAINHGGMKSGPGPFDLVASALGACTAMTIRAAITPDLASASASPPLSDSMQTMEQVWQEAH